jgi:hypothetical protein
MYVGMRKAEECVDTDVGLLLSALLSGGRAGAMAPSVNPCLARGDPAGGAEVEAGFVLRSTLPYRVQVHEIAITGRGTVI